VLLEDFRRDLLDPAHSRCDELRAKIAEAKAELQGLIEAVEYDDEAAAGVQLRIEELARDLARWESRYSFFTSRDVAQSGGRVNV
jgi:hypothetical protein